MVLASIQAAGASPLAISPSPGTTVSGAVKITVSASAPVSWFNLLVDGKWIGSNAGAAAASYHFIWDSSRVSRGTHVVSAVGYDKSNQPVATAAVSLKVAAITYYVARNGSDANDGLARRTSWATVQKAADTMIEGDKAIVAAGTYAEVVTAGTSGKAGYPITFQPDTGAVAKLQSFQIAANYIRVVGFEISNHNSTAPTGFGIHLVGSNAYIANNYIHDLYFEGAMISGNGDPNSAATVNNTLINNRFVRCAMAAAQIEGRNSIIQGNDVSYTQQYPAGGPARAGADADGFRFFGRGHVFRSNRIHDIAWGTAVNPNPHTDCFQTWGPASGVIIERNFCTWPAASNTIDNEVSVVSVEAGAVSAITFRNNVFVRMRQGIHVNGARGVVVFNNTFVGIVQEAAILSQAGSTGIANNIFYDVGSGDDSYVCADPVSRSGLQLNSNDHFMPTGAPGTYCGNAPHLTLNPLFANPSALDFHLQFNSPLIDQGSSLAQVTNDYDGITRPQGAGYDIGAYEFH